MAIGDVRRRHARYVGRLTCCLLGNWCQHALEVVAPVRAVALPAGSVSGLSLRLTHFSRAALTQRY